jgi:4-carboxymuconolactone decarboxylase
MRPAHWKSLAALLLIPAGVVGSAGAAFSEASVREPMVIREQGSFAFGRRSWTDPLAVSRNARAMDRIDRREMMNRLAATAVAMLLSGMSAPAHAQTAPPAQPSRAQTLMGDVAPKLAELTDNVLFGDVWERPQLSKRDRSLVTVSALIAMNRPDQLRSHLVRARDNGVTQEELIEAMTHLAFYAGWPNAVTAITVAKDVFQKK